MNRNKFIKKSLFSKWSLDFQGAIHTSELDRFEKSKAIWVWTLKCEVRSIQDRSKWVWTLSQSELRSISDRSNLDRS